MNAEGTPGRGQGPLAPEADHLPVAVYAASPDGQVLDANPAFIELLRFPDRDAVRGCRLADLCVESEDRVLWRFQQSRQGPASGRWDFQTRLRRRGGPPIAVHAAVRAVRDDAGEVCHCLGSLTDITAQRLAEKQRGEAEGRFRAVLDHAAEGAAVADLVTLQMRTVSPSLCQMLGYGPDEMEALRLPDLLQGTDRAIEPLLDGGLGAADDLALRHKDGGTLTADVTAARVRMEGRPGLLVIVRNAADRHLLASVLRESRRVIKEVTEAATLLFYVVDVAERRCTRVSPQTHHLATTPEQAADLASSLLGERVHPADRQAVDRLLAKAAELPDDDLQVEEQWRLRDADDQWRWYRHRAGVFSRGPDGEVRRILCVAQDVTEQVNDRRGRRAAEGQLQAILEHVSGFLALLSPDGEVVQANCAALRFAAGPRESVIGGPVWNGHWRSASPRDRERLERAVVSARHGHVQHSRVQFLDSEERAVTLDLVIKPVTDSRGETVYLLAEGLQALAAQDSAAG